ncbi:MAG TPA: hypothetical protein VGG02_13875 [Chthoniobacterales bacterium]|jgi:hypothetical protein
MADKNYDILISIEAQVQRLDDAVSQTQQLVQSASGLGSAFEFGGAIELTQKLGEAFTEVEHAILSGVEAGVEFQAKMQDVATGIAAVLEQTQPDKYGTFGAAKAAAVDYIDTIKAAANKVGVSYDDMFEAVQHSQALLANAGVTDINQVIQVTLLLNQALRAVGVSATQASRDLGDILSGAGARTLGGRRLSGALGFDSAEEMDKFILQATQAGTLVQSLTSRMSGLSAAIADASGNFDATINRMKNALVDLEAEAAKPLMQPLQNAINDLTVGGKSDQIAALARSIGDIGVVALGAANGVLQVVSTIDSLIDRYHALSVAIASLPGTGVFGSGLAAAAQAYSNNLSQVEFENMQKTYQALREKVLLAGTDQEKQQAVADISATINSLQAQILSGQIKNTQQAKIFLDLMNGLRAGFSLLAGTIDAPTQKLKGLSDAAKQALAALSDKTALNYAVGSGDQELVTAQRVKEAFDEQKAALIAKGVPEAQAVAAAKDYANSIKSAADYHLQLKDSAAGLKLEHQQLEALLRQEQALLHGMEESQQLIEQNRLLTPDSKEQELVALYTQEKAAIDKLITTYQAYILAHQAAAASDELEKQKIQDLIEKIDELKVKAAGLDLKIDTTGTFGKDFNTQLAQFVNSFGTAGTQAANLLTGSINTALQGTNQLLDGLITGSGDWRQELEGVESQILNVFLTWIEQMALQKIAQLLGITTTTTAQVASGAAIAQAHAPAAAATSVSSYGAAAIIGEILAIAAIAAIIAAISGGFEGGGYTGDGSPSSVAGVVHGGEFVFSKPATDRIGVGALSNIHSIARVGGFQSGGFVGTSGGSGSSGALGGDVHVYNYTDKKKLLDDFQKDPTTKKMIVDTVNSAGGNLRRI